MTTSPTPVLTPEDHRHFLEHGYVVVKNAVPPETLLAALAALEAGAYSGSVGGADYRAVQGEAVSACITDTAHEAIAELFGAGRPFDRVRHGDDMPRPYKPGADWPAPRAHIDDDYPTLMPNGWAVGLFVFLTPVRPHGGAFVVFPGSHRRYQEALAATPGGILGAVAGRDLAGDPEEFLAEPGDILLFHHLLGHTGSENVADPRTRHALLSRWHPQGRIVPGAGAGEATIEKANSGAALGTFACDTGEEAGRILRGGLARPGGLRAHALIHFRGRTHLFCVDGDQPDVVRHARSADLLRWEFGQDAITLPAPVSSLSLFQRGEEVLLMAGAGESVRLFTSRDLDAWAPLADVPGAQSGAGHFNTNYGSRTARGKVLFFVPAGHRGQVRCRWAASWDKVGGGDEAAVAEAPDGWEVAGLCVHPVLGEQRFALMADLTEPGGAGTQPFYSLSGDSAAYAEPLRPLLFTAPAAPRDIRVYSRAREYWLVSYLRQQDGGDRLFWGTIDWQQEPPTVREIGTPEDWAAAFAVVGLA